LCLADFHLGSDASLLLRHELLSTDTHVKPVMNTLDYRPPPPPPRSRKGSTFPLQRFGTRLNKAAFPPKGTVLVGTMDGGLGLLQPLEERMYRRLALLQQIMTMTVPTSFSLNPREYRLLKTAHLRVTRKKGMLDGCLLSLFCTLPPSLQDQLAATVGATSYLIKENLHELDYLCRYF
jgi:hypothetical protein